MKIQREFTQTNGGEVEGILTWTDEEGDRAKLHYDGSEPEGSFCTLHVAEVGQPFEEAPAIYIDAEVAKEISEFLLWRGIDTNVKALPASRVKLEITRTVQVLGASGKPALELEARGDDVRVRPLPSNSSRRESVRLVDLVDGVDQLKR